MHQKQQNLLPKEHVYLPYFLEVYLSFASELNHQYSSYQLASVCHQKQYCKDLMFFQFLQKKEVLLEFPLLLVVDIQEHYHQPFHRFEQVEYYSPFLEYLFHLLFCSVLKRSSLRAYQLSFWTLRFHQVVRQLTVYRVLLQ